LLIVAEFQPDRVLLCQDGEKEKKKKEGRNSGRKEIGVTFNRSRVRDTPETRQIERASDSLRVTYRGLNEPTSVYGGKHGLYSF
jgi:hypothetical protein